MLVQMDVRAAVKFNKPFPERPPGDRKTGFGSLTGYVLRPMGAGAAIQGKAVAQQVNSSQTNHCNWQTRRVKCHRNQRPSTQEGQHIDKIGVPRLFFYCLPVETRKTTPMPAGLRAELGSGLLRGNDAWHA